MASLLELRRQASELGIEDYSKYPKEELQEKINEVLAGKKAEETHGGVLGDDEETKEEREEREAAEEKKEFEETEAQVKELEEKGEVEDITGDPEAQITGKVKGQKKEKTQEAKAPKKTVKKEVSEKKATAAVLNVKPIEGKETPTGKTSSLIYAELLKNDGRSFGAIAKDLSTHYNMVRNVKEKYFEDVIEEAAAE